MFKTSERTALSVRWAGLGLAALAIATALLRTIPQMISYFSAVFGMLFSGASLALLGLAVITLSIGFLLQGKELQ